MSDFNLVSKYKPAGDQPVAIRALLDGLSDGLTHQTLLGVTGSGKTFAAANVIAEFGKPTLVMAHNKTLAAQLAQEYKEFFPENAVQYFVSYYDFYQPEAYLPTTDTYIEKDAQINEEIERLRHATTQALLTRKDVIVVASVSAIYGLGSPEEYEKVHVKIARGDTVVRRDFIRRLIDVYYERTNADLSPGTFRVVGNAIEIMPPNAREIVRLELAGNTLARIKHIDAVSRVVTREEENTFLFPAKHFVTPEDERKRAIDKIRSELKERLAYFEKAGKLLEADRLKRRTNYDMALMEEVGYCNGIENYSRHFDGREEGEPANTLLSYFPKNKTGRPDFLTIIDESHVTIPQIGGMYNGDRARKQNLIEHGFRLPSALDNRPLQFDEFEERVGQRIYTSATPGEYERKNSSKTVEMIIRPTGLVDPEVEVRPIQEGDAGKAKTSRNVSQSEEYRGQVKDFIAEIEETVAGGARVITTTLTKKMAEELAAYLKDKEIKAEYLHSEIRTIERIEILTKFRKGEFDVLVGVNLLREGLDLPEVELIGILDADKEGFLRSETSLIQTIGRAARNVNGRVILYADTMTGSMERAIGETNRRRDRQLAYNKEHGITPKTISKQIKDITEELRGEYHDVAAQELARELGEKPTKTVIRKLIKTKDKQMNATVKILDFETAAILRDEIKELEEMIDKKR